MPFPAAFSKWVAYKLGDSRNPFPHQTEINSPSDCKTVARLVVTLSGARFGDVREWTDLFQVLQANHIYVQGCTAEEFHHDRDGRDAYLERLAAITWSLIIKFEVSQCVDARCDVAIREVMAQETLKHWASSLVGEFGIEMCNWTTSWKDGMVLLTLLNVATGGEVDIADAYTIAEIDTSQAMMNVEAALDGFEKLGIPRLLDARFVVGPIQQDGMLKKSLVTYVALVHNKLQSMAF